MNTYTLHDIAAPVERHALGRWGEAAVATWCVARGWEVLAAGVRARDSELDLVIRDGDRIAFCEVRTRRTTTGPTALESIGPRKQQRVRRGAERWMGELQSMPEAWHFHFDVYALEPGPMGQGWVLIRVEDAF
ncbi:MAG: YraN family protein [bacterium]